MDQQPTVYWITGASSGIGEALAKQLGRSGNALIISGRNIESLKKLKAELPAEIQVEILPFELTQIGEFAQLVDQAIHFFGHIDVLVNNAGVSQRSPAMETSEDVERKLMEINYFAPVALTKALLPHFVARKRGTS